MELRIFWCRKTAGAGVRFVAKLADSSRAMENIKSEKRERLGILMMRNKINGFIIYNFLFWIVFGMSE